MRALGHCLLKDLQPLPGQFRAQIAQACDVPPRARQAGDEPYGNRIRGPRHDDGDRARGVLGRADRAGSPSDNHVHLEPDQLRRQAGEPLFTLRRIAGLQDEVLALHIAEVAQTLPEGLQTGIRPRGRVAAAEPPDPIHRRRRLGLGGERHEQESEGKDEEEGKGTAHHRSLRRSQMCGGILRAMSSGRNLNFVD
jgi:hypothetical protein